MVLTFDIYGTLIDPFSIEAEMKPVFGARAHDACELWRQKQLEYSFRRALMRCYMSFNVCTEQALNFAAAHFRVALTHDQRKDLLGLYRKLPAYPDVAPALNRLHAKPVAFSNGTEEAVRGLLANAGILHRFADVISVEGVHSFKPDPVVYDHLAQRTGASKNEIWMVSSNPFDVIGAKSAGLHAIWLKRDGTRIFDPWEFAPDKTITSLTELEHL